MMKKVAAAVLSLGCAVLVVDASTRVAVLQFGKKVTVRRTTATNAETSKEGVASFWQALHHNGQQRRKLQAAGMTVVPDLFYQPDSGIVIGLSGNFDIEQLPTVARLVSEEDEHVVGTMEVEEGTCCDLLDYVKDVEITDSLKTTVPKHAEKTGLSGIKAIVDSSNSATVDQEISDVISHLERFAEESGKTIVVHVIVDEPVEAFRQRVLMSRRLNNNNNVDDDNANDDGSSSSSSSQQQYSGYYGYGYYNAYGEWVTPYKTMFQIQYFNVVTWTAIGLAVSLIFTIYLMLYMPLEPDTLLFGESAKLVGDD